MRTEFLHELLHAELADVLPTAAEGGGGSEARAVCTHTHTHTQTRTATRTLQNHTIGIPYHNTTSTKVGACMCAAVHTVAFVNTVSSGEEVDPKTVIAQIDIALYTPQYITYNTHSDHGRGVM